MPSSLSLARMYLGFVKEVGPGPSSLSLAKNVFWVCGRSGACAKLAALARMYLGFVHRENKHCFRMKENNKKHPEEEQQQHSTYIRKNGLTCHEILRATFYSKRDFEI